jgi:hypothetical protein
VVADLRSYDLERLTDLRVGPTHGWLSRMAELRGRLPKAWVVLAELKGHRDK